MNPALRLRSDDHLVRLFRAGREDAFEAIHDRHARRLHAAAARALRTHGGDPEGIVQEAFIRAHRALRGERAPAELKPWLHRIVRNLCIDELRRTRAVSLDDDDDEIQVPAGEDVYSTLSRRHELRGLIDDLADLPEQQRAALLMRELDGLTHDEVASVLEITPQASRQLVMRARTRLNAAAEARDAACGDIRDDLLVAHDEKRRPSEHALRHVRGCSACAEFRANLKATRSRLRVLVPPIGFGPLGGLLSGLGGGGGVATKVVAGGCCAVLAAGGATAWVAGQTEVVRDRAPAAEGGGRALIGTPIRKGSALPPDVAIAKLTVELPARQRTFKRLSARVSCPAGMVAAGLAQPRTQDGKLALEHLAMYQISKADHRRLARGRPSRTTEIEYAAQRRDAPLVISVGTLCKRR
ncbi:sigma-70 family RNA polymerase sigma factor [Solirubrobacter sp. CPCC 204708]|uniref:Sigma-70 family RNA polymerase sigma factor n=1 Tax=Solirubrobacter deserti TaxID=2282478 RepID=A0ABT4RKI6_9ACTN|nr:sigma-70 family RNA polymerase sigma factor [Solirubrobacter deserti]MBE2317336.1 sigma-70 family RNA polymerase sigma factor [Solirubrobacter deserti]MDA0139065.1 sigma-70 family RNA polymerase sigma factor [Solirubrobacter deserti]